METPLRVTPSFVFPCAVLLNNSWIPLSFINENDNTAIIIIAFVVFTAFVYCLSSSVIVAVVRIVSRELTGLNRISFSFLSSASSFVLCSLCPNDCAKPLTAASAALPLGCCHFALGGGQGDSAARRLKTPRPVREKFVYSYSVAQSHTR